MAKTKKSSSTESVHEEKTAKKLQEFQGFKVLPVIMNENDKSIRHYFYFKKHESRSLVDENIRDRTLFVLNLPADTTDRHLRKLFKGHGIDQITYSDAGSSVTEEYWKITQQQLAKEQEEKKNKKKKNNKKRKQQEEEEEEEEPEKRELRHLYTSGSSAHIVFSSDEDLEQVLNMTRVEKKWAKEDTDHEQPLGIDRYILAYELSRPDAEALQMEVDSFLKKFKDEEYQKEREKLERMNQMDEDGFTVVVRHKKNKTTDGSVNVAAVSAEMAEAQIQYQAKKKKELVNFYRFQMREQKQNELVELRKRFEEDKAKIARLKQNRKFKPY